jgi:hypothetical protein
VRPSAAGSGTEALIAGNAEQEFQQQLLLLKLLAWLD